MREGFSTGEVGQFSPEISRAEIGDIKEPPLGGDVAADDVAEMFEKFEEIAKAQNEANKKLAEYAEREPIIKQVLETPQSRDKHAEGPRVVDHYREILTSLALMRDGQLDFETMRDALNLPEEARDQWDKIVKVVKEHPKLFEAIVMAHDLGKAETVGFVSAKPELEFPDKKTALLLRKMTQLRRRRGRSGWQSTANFLILFPRRIRNFPMMG